jgi:hypothetical protein
MSLHPDLDALSARYQELHSAATHGHITPDDALATLSGLSVVDGGGSVWKINKEGDFTRSEYPGAPPVLSDPNTYIGPETVVSNPEHNAYNIGPQQPVDNGWGTTPAADPFGAPATPGGFGGAPATGGFGTGQQPAPGGFGAPPAAGGFTPPAGGFGAPAGNDGGFIAPSQAPTSPFEQAPGHAPFTAPEHNIAPQSLSGSPMPRERAAKTREPRDPSQLIAKLKKNKVLVVIAVIAIAILAQRFLFSGGEGTTIPNKPTATFTADPATQSPSLAGDQAPGTAPLPVADDVSAVVGALTDGDRDLISAQVVLGADPGRVAHAAAFYKGLKGAGLELKTGEGAPGPKENTAVQLWTVAAGATDLLSIQVAWTLQDGKWLLSDVPLPQ